MSIRPGFHGVDYSISISSVMVDNTLSYEFTRKDQVYIT